MSLQSLFRRRPSASLVISCVALFVALGGAAWAATSLPSNSVGTQQLRNGAVTGSKIKNDAVNFNKIAMGTVGIKRINTGQVQARVSGGCSGAAGAIGAVASNGHVTCNLTLPTQLGLTSGSVPISTSATTIGTKALPASTNFLVIANPYAVISSATAGQRVVVTCTLSANGVSESRTAQVEIGAKTQRLETAIPIVLPAPASAAAGSATVACSQASSPSAPRSSVSVSTTINALTVAANG
jgi:hypothetical protein